MLFEEKNAFQRAIPPISEQASTTSRLIDGGKESTARVVQFSESVFDSGIFWLVVFVDIPPCFLSRMCIEWK